MTTNLLRLTRSNPVIICWAACLALFLAGSARASDSTVEEKVKAIRGRYDEVEKELSHCKQVKRELMEESTEGGELTAWVSGSSVRKLAAKFYGEMGQALEEYYFWDDRLFFVLRVEKRYDKPLSGTVRSKTEERFYFADDSLIRWLDPAKKEVPAGTKFEERGRDFLARAKRYSAMARN
ncbi:MAG: hypothetical protein QOH88_2149 [Verrucomicrobiota bacterium]|jgi:hypothetical protein